MHSSRVIRQFCECSLIQHLHRLAEHNDESPYTPPSQPASCYDSTLYMLSASHGEPRHTGRQTKAYLPFWPQSSTWELYPW